MFVDSGISDGFDFGVGDGPNRVGNLHAVLVAENLDSGAVFDCGYPWGGPRLAGPVLDRDVLGDSINFDVPLAACDGNVQFRATVTQPGPAASSAAPASGSVNVSFAPLGKQEFLPFLVTDPSSALPTPTMGGFYSCLAGPESAHPFPDNGFTINPPLAHTLAAAESLRVPANWTWLVMRLSTMLFLFPSQPVAGVRMAVVPPIRRSTGAAWHCRAEVSPLPQWQSRPAGRPCAHTSWARVGAAARQLRRGRRAVRRAAPDDERSGARRDDADPRQVGLRRDDVLLRPAGLALDPALRAHAQVHPLRMRVLTFSAILQDGELVLEPGFVADGEPSQAKGELTVEALGRTGKPLAKTALALEMPCMPPGGEVDAPPSASLRFPPPRPACGSA